MNIAEMMVAMSIDPSGVSEGLNQAEKLIGGFGKRLSGAFNTKDLLSAPAVQTQATLAAKILDDFLAKFSGSQKPLVLPVELTGVEAASRQADRLEAIARQARDAGGRFVSIDVAPTSALQAALARVAEETKALARSAPITLKTGPAVEAADTLIARLGLVAKTATDLRSVLNQPITLPKLPAQVTAPPVVVPPPDFSGFLQETERAIKAARAEIITGLNAGGVIEHSGVAAGLSVIRGLESGALSQLRGLGKQVAQGLIDPAEGVRQADRLIESVSREMRARQGELAAVVNQARRNALGTGANISGITTARTGGFVDTGELDAAEKAFDRLEGVSDATNQSFLRVGSSSSKMAIGVRGAASNLSILAAQSIGATGAVGTLAQNILLFSGGIPVVAAVAAAVLALAKTYEFLNTKQREADERSQKLRDGLRQEVERLSATETATLGLAAAIDAEAKARESLFTKIARPVANTLDILGSPSTTVTAGLIETQRRQQEELLHSIQEQHQAKEDLAALEVKSLSEALGLNKATTAQQERASELVKQLTSQEQILVLSSKQRLQNHERLNILQSGMLDGVRQEIALRAAQASAEQNRLTALAAAPALGTDTPASIRERAAEMARLNAVINSANPILTERNQAQAQFNQLLEAQQAPDLRTFARQEQAIRDALNAATGLAKVQADLAAGPELDALIAKYRQLEKAAKGDTAQIQQLADKRRELEKLRTSTDDALKSFANIGGGAKDLPTLQFKATLDFVSPIEAIVDTVTGRAEARIRANLDKILAELKQRSDAAFRAELGNVQLPDTTIPAGFDRAQESVRDLNDELTKAARASNKFFAKAEKDAEDLRKPMEKLNDSIHDITRGLDSVVGAAHNIGLIGDQAANAINSVLDLADAIGQVAEKASAGNILALIGAGVGAIGGLLGPSQAEIEGNRIREENNKRLAELTQSLDRQLLGAGKLDVGAKAVASVQGALDARVFLSKDSGKAGALQKGLDAAGLSLIEFEKLVKDTTGIEILNSKGKLVAGTLEQANKAFEKIIFEATHFADTFAEQSLRLNLGARLRGEDVGTSASFDREIAAASGLSDAVKQAFAGVDTKNEDALRAALVDLFDKFDRGQITAEQLGGLSKDDFLKLLGDGADALDSFKTATDDAVDALASMTNVPNGFKAAALEWAATLPEQVTVAAPPVTPPPKPNIDPTALDGVELRVDPGFVDELQRLTDASALAQLNTLNALEPLPKALTQLTSSFPTGLSDAVDRLGLRTPRDLLDALTEIQTRSPGDLLSALEVLQSTTAPDLLTAIREIRDALKANASGDRSTSTAPPSRAVGDVTITINPLPGMDSFAIAMDTRSEFERLAMRHTGDSLDRGV